MFEQGKKKYLGQDIGLQNYVKRNRRSPPQMHEPYRYLDKPPSTTYQFLQHLAHSHIRRTKCTLSFLLIELITSSVGKHHTW